jgi:hypothetical protein
MKGLPVLDAAAKWKEVSMGGSPEAEQRLFAEVLPKIASIQRTVSARQAATIKRGFHNKGDPLKLRFEVADALPAVLQVGFLRPGAKYDGFGRFSRAQSYSRKDSAFDGRGFAFRIATEDGPQDFLLSNTPVSFAPDPVVFVKAAEVFANSSVLATPLKLMLVLGLRTGFAIARNLLLTTPDRSVSFTGQRYWSRVPFQLGAVAVKLVAVPVPDEEAKCAGSDPDFLTAQLREELRRGERRFALHAQLFADERRTPIEDASLEWREEDAPLAPIGRIVIPRQDLDDASSRAWAAGIEREAAFNPWNTVHLRPLGSMNRARRQAYDLSAITRGGRVLGVATAEER